MVQIVDLEYLRRQIDKKFGNPSNFATELGVTRQHVHAILKGEREPSLSLLVEMATKLGVQVHNLLLKEPVMAGTQGSDHE